MSTPPEAVMDPVQPPTPSPAPLADQLPALGQRFSSVSSFKLQAYRALGVSPSSFAGSSKHAQVRCRLTTLSTEHALNQKGAKCTWLVSANNRNCDGEFEVEVDRVCLVHTCPEACRPAYAVEDMPDLERKISTMEDRVRAEEERARRVDQAADEPAPSSAASSSSMSASSSRTAVESSSGSRKLRRKRPINYKVPGRFDLDELLDDGGPEELYPRVEQLKDKISDIVLNGAVPKPARGQTFDNSPTLLATMHAYAQQNGFHLYRGSEAYKLDRVSIVCRRNHARFEDSPTGRCPVQVDAERNDNDSWRIVAVKLQHNHTLDGARAASTASQGPSKRARYQAPSPQPHQKPLPAPLSSTAPPRSSCDLVGETPARSVACPTAAAPLAVPPRRSDPSLTSSTSSPPSADLVAFLSALYSPDLAADTASTLARAGLSTAKHLALLLDLEPPILQVLDDELRLHDGDFGRSWSLVDVQKEMREAFAGL
ncbi:hypothetical protein JCM8208_000660 [Rhodotorula glutinis]